MISTVEKVCSEKNVVAMAEYAVMFAVTLATMIGLLRVVGFLH